jgi:hypothetical protein
VAAAPSSLTDGKIGVVEPEEILREAGFDQGSLASELDQAAANAPDGRFLALESCHSTWLFDLADRRFCRVLKSSALVSSVATDWRPYDRLVVHPSSDAFVVFLDSSGTKLLRSWRHTSRCDRCDGEVTAQMSLEELRRVTRA